MKNNFRKIALFFGQFWYRNKSSKILFYHDIHLLSPYTEMSTSLALFKQHVTAIKQEGFQIVSDIKEQSLEVAIQLDDGFKGIYDCLPYFIKEKIPVELFVITSRIGQENYLSEEELIALDRSGFVRISAHTHQHIELGSCTEEEIRLELMQSKKILERILGRVVQSVCYPKGVFSASVVSIANSCGFKSQYSSLPGNYFDMPYANVYKRNLVQFATASEIKYCLRGAHELFANRYFKKQFVK